MEKSIATVRENHQSLFSVDIQVSGHEFMGDEPQEMGGGNKGPSPYDLLASALGSCTVMTMRWYAQRQGWPLEKAEATITHEKRDGQDFFEKRVIIHGADLTIEQRNKLYDVSTRCPVHKTLTSSIIINSYMDEM